MCHTAIAVYNKYALDNDIRLLLVKLSLFRGVGALVLLFACVYCAVCSFTTECNFRTCLREVSWADGYGGRCVGEEGRSFEMTVYVCCIGLGNGSVRDIGCESLSTRII